MDPWPAFLKDGLKRLRREPRESDSRGDLFKGPYRLFGGLADDQGLKGGILIRDLKGFLGVV